MWTLNKKKMVMFIVPEDTSMLSGLVGVTSYLRSLVTEEDQVKMNEVNGPSLFIEVQKALNRVYLLPFPS